MSDLTLSTRRVAPLLTLKNVLAFDGLTGLGMGVVLLAATDPLAALLGLPGALLQGAAAVLLPFVALMFVAARQVPPHRGLVWCIILGNWAWVLASVAVAVVLQPSAWGAAFVWVQALAVAVLATLETRGLKAG